MTRALTAFDHLAKLARAGDVAGTEQFLVELMGHVEAAVVQRARRLGRLGPAADVREDMVQDLLIELWQDDLHSWDETRGAFLTYAKTRLCWKLASHARAQTRFVSDVDVYDGVVAEASDPESLLARAGRDRDLRALQQVIDHVLPMAERVLVRRVDLNQESLTSVARRRNMHISRACRMRQQAHQRIAGAMSARAA